MRAAKAIVNRVRIQYTSHLFVDVKRTIRPPITPAPGAQHLALLGDIGDPQEGSTIEFINYCADHWDRVYWVPGAHEIKRYRTIDEAVETMRELPATVMARGEDWIGCGSSGRSIRVLGAPCWTSLGSSWIGGPRGDDYKRGLMREWYRGKGVRTMLEEKNEDWTFLKESFEQHNGVPTLVLSYTHPLFAFSGSALERAILDTNAFLTDSDDFVGKGICGWLSGATGVTVSGMCNGVYVATAGAACAGSQGGVLEISTATGSAGPLATTGSSSAAAATAALH